MKKVLTTCGYCGCGCNFYLNVENDEIVGVTPIRQIARLYAKANTASIIYAMGITQHVSGSENVAALANLALLTGQIGRESTGVNPLRGQNNVQGACDMGVLPNNLPGYQALNNAIVKEKFRRVWGNGLSSYMEHFSMQIRKW